MWLLTAENLHLFSGSLHIFARTPNLHCLHKNLYEAYAKMKFRSLLSHLSDGAGRRNANNPTNECHCLRIPSQRL